MKVLVTGAAGFIGYHLSKELLSRGFEVHGLDNLNEYYSQELKLLRLSQLKSDQNSSNFVFHKSDLSDTKSMQTIFAKEEFEIVINLAAQAGVRYSLENPHSYIDSNVNGFLNIVEGCRYHNVKHLIFASSSSVYGMNKKTPFNTDDRVDSPISLYAATKKSNELIAHTYSHLFNIPITGLRFFTVYGPYGRPDMAYYSFTRKILEEKPLNIFNNGKMKRDFTYIDDVINGIVSLINEVPEPQPSLTTHAKAPYRLFNIGNNKPSNLEEFIAILENACGKKAIKKYLPMQPGDVPETYADIDELAAKTGFKPSTSLEVGLNRFVDWYKNYHK